MRSLRGMSLIEIIIYGAMAGVVLTMIAQTMVLGMRNAMRQSNHIERLRQGSLALDQLKRDMRLAVDIYAPFPTKSMLQAGVDYMADAPSDPLVIRRMGKLGQDEVVAYHRNPVTRALERFRYDPVGYDPFVDATPPSVVPGSRQVLAQEVTRFRIQRVQASPLEAPNLQLELTVFTGTRNVKQMIEVGLRRPILSSD